MISLASCSFREKCGEGKRALNTGRCEIKHIYSFCYERIRVDIRPGFFVFSELWLNGDITTTYKKQPVYDRRILQDYMQIAFHYQMSQQIGLSHESCVIFQKGSFSTKMQVNGCSPGRDGNPAQKMGHFCVYVN